MTENADPDTPKPLENAVEPGKSATKPRGRPFQKGNPGKPKGTRHKTTTAIEALFDGEGQKLTRKAIKMAMAGDSVIMKACLDRIAPVRKGRRVTFMLPAIQNTRDVVDALSAVAAAMATGQISPAEAVEIGAVVELQRRAVEQQDLETRISAMEEKFK